MSDRDWPGGLSEENLKAVNDNMLDGLGKLAEYFGYSKVMGQLYGALLLNPTPLSLDDLAAFLRKSKANVSTNLRILENMGTVREVWVRGSRRKFYTAETDFWRILINVLSNREMRDLERALQVLEQSVEQLRRTMPQMSEENLKLAQFYVERIDSIRVLFRFAQVILNSILQQAGKFDVSEVQRVRIE